MAAGNKQRSRRQKNIAEGISVTQATNATDVFAGAGDFDDEPLLDKCEIEEDESGLTGATSTKEAERALLGVRSRLSGEQSVECRVNELINSARSAENLALMFHGWEPWL